MKKLGKVKLNKKAMWIAGGIATLGLATTAYFAFLAPLFKKNEEEEEPKLGDYTKSATTPTATSSTVASSTNTATAPTTNFSWLVNGASSTTQAQPRIGKLTANSNIRTAPSTSASIHQTWPAGTAIPVTGEVTGSSVGGNNKWYKMGVSAPHYYVHSSLVRF